MSGEHQPYIGIDTYAGEPDEGAVEAAAVLNDLVHTTPGDVLTTLDKTHAELTNPSTTADTITTKGLSDQQQTIARAVLNLLAVTKQGSDVSFDDTTYDDILMKDPDHLALIGALNRTEVSGRHEKAANYPHHRAIAVSGIRKVAQILSASNMASANDNMEAAS